MISRLLAAMLFFAFMQVPPAMAQQLLLDTAVEAALNTFETAWPRIGSADFGVDGTAYRDALGLHQFQSGHWGGTVRVDLAIADQASGPCSRFAAYTRMPPDSGTIRLIFCPQFFADGADTLRELTILHEMVHVVAGGDECQAMAYAARIEMLARGNYTPVAAYWQANDCDGTAFSLP